ncbi:MAG TPA: hypothetical protein VMT21_05595 [Gemmatimonadales bacterium]|nr:hypothetical protein [Gemmatimonadales bacterium]
MNVRAMLSTVALTAAAAMPLGAQEQPVQLSLFTPVQIVPESQGVSALRLNLIYSVNTSVRYFDWGLVNVTSGGPSAGVQWALVAINKGSFSGWQAAAGAITQGQFKGLQSGWFTSAKQGEGVQWGLVNTAEYWNGLQFGLVNYAQRLHGVQIGLINIIKTGGQFPFFPIVNWSF